MDLDAANQVVGTTWLLKYAEMHCGVVIPPHPGGSGPLMKAGGGDRQAIATDLTVVKGRNDRLDVTTICWTYFPPGAVFKVELDGQVDASLSSYANVHKLVCDIFGHRNRTTHNALLDVSCIGICGRRIGYQIVRGITAGGGERIAGKLTWIAFIGF